MCLTDGKLLSLARIRNFENSKTNDTMKKKNNSSIWMVLILVVIAFFAVICITIPPQIYDTNQFIFQIIAVFLSVLFTAIVTNTLLSYQSRSEEDKDKNVKIHENKVKAYSNFMRSLWIVLDDGKVTSEEIKKIRSELFEDIFLYLDNKGLVSVEESINSFKDKVADAQPEDNDSSKGTGFYRDFAISIASCLKNDINDKEEEKVGLLKTSIRKERKSREPNMDEMWSSLEFISSKYPSQSDLVGEKGIAIDMPKVGANQIEGEQSVSSGDESSEQEPVRELKSQAWHFSEWSEIQLQYLKEGGQELSLVEYDEYWRTNLVQQVMPGDVVFLFKGSWKYAGVFVAKGWRVFEYDEQRYVKEITSDGIEKAVVTGEKVPIDSVKDKLAKYDIYGSYLDPNSTSCANVIVDTISFIPEGVVTPNTTYRKTISRYYWEYAVRLLDKFDEAESEQNKKKIAELFK